MSALVPELLLCRICDKAFLRKSDLTRHKLLHTGVKPHKCTECGKGFSQASGLRTHRNIHTKAKPFRCGLGDCHAVFGDPSSCSRHRKEFHSRVGAYRCPYPSCQSSIKRRSAFVAHLRKHGINPSTVDINAMAPGRKTSHHTEGQIAHPTDIFRNMTARDFTQLTHHFQPGLLPQDSIETVAMQPFHVLVYPVPYYPVLTQGQQPEPSQPQLLDEGLFALYASYPGPPSTPSLTNSSASSVTSSPASVTGQSFSNTPSPAPDHDGKVCLMGTPQLEAWYESLHIPSAAQTMDVF